MRLGSGYSAMCSRLAGLASPSSAGLGVGWGWGAEAPLKLWLPWCRGTHSWGWLGPPKSFLGENWNQPCPTSCTNQL